MIRIAIVVVVLGMGATANARCYDTTSIIGYSHCHTYGSWGADHDASDVSLDANGFFVLRRIVLPASSEVAMLSNGVPIHFGGARRVRHALGAGARVFGVDVGSLIFGAEGSVARGLTDGGLTSPDLPSFPTGLTAINFSVIVGLRTRGWHTDLRTELAPGVEANLLGGPCVGSVCLASSAPPQLAMEVRVRADHWFTRYLTIGVAVGANLAVPGELSFAVVATAHDRPYDGW